MIDWNAADADDIMEDCRVTANIAIQAMREPTEAMKRSYGLVTNLGGDIWCSMIDEALK